MVGPFLAATGGWQRVDVHSQLVFPARTVCPKNKTKIQLKPPLYLLNYSLLCG